MAYRTLRECCLELEHHKMLLRLKDPLDPELVIPEIHRRIYQSEGPALLFENVLGSPFPALSNLFGTSQRTEFIFRDSLKKLEWLCRLKADPKAVLRKPWKFVKFLPLLFKAIPKKVNSNALKHQCLITELPQIKSWPMDGGAFITLPQVISFAPGSLNPSKANVGMYRIQLGGNDYLPNQEIGLHYQLHRGIGIHHREYLNRQIPFNITIAVGGPPANTLAAIFPMPEDLSEILFSGLLNNRRYRYSIQQDLFVPQDADFCITGTVNLQSLKTEGPFGDHLGYYSLAHNFPFLENIKVYHRENPIWHFTVVGRPPQEDSSFGYLIHQITSTLTSSEYPGIKEIHAVDAAGVHPLLLAIGSERYMPFRSRKPEEILTQANHLLGKGQTSLAKYLFIAADDENIKINTKDIQGYFQYILERVDWNHDLHFYTRTTIDTLDYSGDDWNSGSKLVIACNREPLRQLEYDLMPFESLPLPFQNARLIQKGVIAIQGPLFTSYANAPQQMIKLLDFLSKEDFQNFPLVIVCDDSDFISQNYNNFLWVTFTRSNPSHDIYGVQATHLFKHWSCGHTLIIDARTKPHHAPVLEVDKSTHKIVDEIIFRNPELKKIIK